VVWFIGKRVLQGLLALIGASMIIFVLVRLTGNPAVLMLPPDASQADIARVTAQLGLDKPIPEQYAIFVSGVVRGDFGDSLQLHQPVLSLIAQRLPYSLALGGLSLLFAVLIGIPLGAISALKRGTAIDHVARGIAVLGQSIPGFWLAIILIAIFAGKLNLLPAAQANTWQSYILPVATLVATGFLLSGTIRFLRSGMLDVLSEDYIRTARAKGLTEFLVVSRHAFKNAVIPLVTFLAFYLVALIGGASLIVETVFAWPGIGPLLAGAVLSRDFPVVQAVTILYVAGLIVMSIVVDLLYAFLDPTIRFS
jgi:peptide/nickel transport system permease protein